MMREASFPHGRPNEKNKPDVFVCVTKYSGSSCTVLVVMVDREKMIKYIKYSYTEILEVNSFAFALYIYKTEMSVRLFVCLSITFWRGDGGEDGEGGKEGGGAMGEGGFHRWNALVATRLERRGGGGREAGRMDKEGGGNEEGGFHRCLGGHTFPEQRRVTQLDI